MKSTALPEQDRGMRGVAVAPWSMTGGGVERSLGAARKVRAPRLHYDSVRWGACLQVDLEFLKKHYASLSDEAFDEINRGELVGAAQQIYDAERSVRAPAPQVAVSRPPVEATARAMPSGPEPDWLEEASCACSFPAPQGNYNAQAAEQVRHALEGAGIPVFLMSHQEAPPKDPRPVSEIRIMIPSRYSLRAESVMDHEIYNVEVEEMWKTHLAMLSDEEFKELDFEALIGGLTDRLERLRRAYKDEVAARE